IDYKALPTNSGSANLLAQSSDPRTSNQWFVFEEFVPPEYRDQLTNPMKKRNALGFSIKPKQWKPATTLNGKPYTSGMPPRSPGYGTTDFDTILENTKGVTRRISAGDDTTESRNSNPPTTNQASVAAARPTVVPPVQTLPGPSIDLESRQTWPDTFVSRDSLADRSRLDLDFPDVGNSSVDVRPPSDTNQGPTLPSRETYTLEPPGHSGITSLMTTSEVIACLTNWGCSNITDMLDETSCSIYPVANGGFGDVYRGTLKSGTQVAVKTMRLRAVVCGNENQKSLKSAARELYTWSKCQHRNVQCLLGLVEFRGQIGMVSRWEVNGNLSDYIQQQPKADRILLSTQLAEGLSYLHGAGVVHGDLKALNVLVSEEGIPLLSDFGSATLQEYTLKFTTTSTKNALSYRWASPELLEGRAICSAAADVYALGMTILETITGRIPWHGKTDTAVACAVMIMKVHPERPQDHIPEGSRHGNILWSLLQSCWAYEPDDRPSATQVKERVSTCGSYHE
ncbi:hypothetical protein FRC08_015072, partial [Ceratobasidium sp. 394]